MDITRRGFLVGAGAGAFAGAASEGTEASPPARGTTTTTICPFCGVGCGQVVEVRDGKVVGIEGDREHPINEGSLCSKGASLYQVHHNERRLQKIRYRTRGSGDWQELRWDEAVRMIAERVKRTRDATWVGQRDGQVLNHTSGIACLGGAALDTEECYALSKAMRALGVVWLEHQARI